MSTIIGTPALFVAGGNYTAESGSDRLVVVAVAKEVTASAPFTSVTFGGVAMTSLAQSVSTVTTDYPHAEIWYLPEASIPVGASAIVVSPTHSTSRGVAYTLGGADQAPSKFLELAGGQDAYLSGTVNGLAASDLVIAIYANQYSSRYATWPAELSTRYDDGSHGNLSISSADGTGITGDYNFSGGWTGASATNAQAIALGVFPSNAPTSETATTGNIPLAIQAGYTKVDLVDPVTTNASLLFGVAGDTPVTGDDLEYDVTSTLDSGVSLSVAATGVWTVTEAVSGDWVTDITVSRRVVQADGTIGTEAVVTLSAATGTTTFTGMIQPMISNMVTDMIN